MIPALPLTSDLRLRLSATPMAVLLDIDGTLAPIAPRPEQALVPPETCKAIADLTNLPGAHVALVSGRSVEDARRLVGLPKLGVIGNHGFEVLGEDGELLSEPAAHFYLDAIRSAAARLASQTKSLHGVVLEDKKWTLSLHYRLAIRSDIPRITALVNNAGTDLGLVVTRGKEVLELRPPMKINKGTASVLWTKQLGANAAVYIGDDRTDEDAFRDLRVEFPRAVTIRVGDPDHGEETAAEFRLETPLEVREFLVAVAATRCGEQKAS